MWGKLNIAAFIIAFALGLFFIYMFTPAPEIVVKFPSPWNSGQVVYQDDSVSNGCYVYNAERTTCPIDPISIKPQPMFYGTHMGM